MALTEAQKKALAAFGPAPTSPAKDPNLNDAQVKALSAFTAANPPPPPAPSPYDTWGGTMAELGKVLGSTVEQAGTSIAGMPGEAGQFYNSLRDSVPAPVRPVLDGLSPMSAALGIAKKMDLFPTSAELDKGLQDNGMMHKPINAAEDWAQYLGSNALTAAIPFSKGGKVADMAWTAAKNAGKSIIPAVAGRGVQEMAPDMPGAGLVAALAAAAGQHGVGRLAQPSISVSKQLAADLPPDAVAQLTEANRLKVPSKTIDFVRPDSSTERKVQDIAGAYPEKSASLLTSLAERNKDAPGRVQRYIADSLNMGKSAPTAEAHATQLNSVKAKQADSVYTDIANSTADSNHAVAGRLALGLIKGKSIDLTPLQATAKKVVGLLYKRGEENALRPNYEARNAYAARTVIEKAIAKDPTLADHLQPIHDELTAGIAHSHPEIHAADEVSKQIKERQDALKAGQEAANKRSANVEKEYARLGQSPNPDHASNLQKSYQIGYADALSKKVEGVRPGNSATNPIGSVGQTKKMQALLNPDLVKQRDLEAAGNKSLSTFTGRKGDTPGAVQTGLQKIGQGSLTLGGLTYGLKNFAMHPVLGASVMGAGITNYLRKNAANNTFLHAAGINTPEELAAFLAKGAKATKLSKNVGRAGILYQLNNH